MEPIKITVYSDYIWPYCYIGKGLVEELKKEFPIQDKWLPYEIHPDTPADGVLLADYFPGMNPEAFFKQLSARGREMGIVFGPQKVMSNSRQAMEAGEFAKEQGRFEEFHEAVFRAFFTDCKNIGNRQVILEAAQSAGVDEKQLTRALDAGTFLPRLKETARLARENGITAAPTFLIQGGGRIVGAQPIESFRAVLSAGPRPKGAML